MYLYSLSPIIQHGKHNNNFWLKNVKKQRICKTVPGAEVGMTVGVGGISVVEPVGLGWAGLGFNDGNKTIIIFVCF